MSASAVVLIAFAVLAATLVAVMWIAAWRGGAPRPGQRMSAHVDMWDMPRVDVWTHALRTLVDNDNVDRAVLVLRLDRGSRLDNEAADLLEYLDSRRVAP